MRLFLGLCLVLLMLFSFMAVNAEAAGPFNRGPNVQFNFGNNGFRGNGFRGNGFRGNFGFRANFFAPRVNSFGVPVPVPVPVPVNSGFGVSSFRGFAVPFAAPGCF